MAGMAQAWAESNGMNALPGKPEPAHDFVHHKRGARQITGVFQQRKREKQNADLRQEHEYATNAANDAIDQQALQIAFRNMRRHPCADVCKEMVNEVHRNFCGPENQDKERQHDAGKNGHAGDRMRQDFVQFLGVLRTARDGGIHHLGRNGFSPLVTRLIGTSAAYGAIGFAVGDGLRHRAGGKASDFTPKFVNALSGARGNRHNGTAEFGAEFFDIDVNALAPGRVHHVQRDDDRAIEFENLADKKKISLKICRVHDDQRGVRGGMFREAAAQGVARHFFLRRRDFPDRKVRANPR